MKHPPISLITGNGAIISVNRMASPSQLRAGKQKLLLFLLQTRKRCKEDDILNERGYWLLDHCIVSCYVSLRRLEHESA